MFPFIQVDDDGFEYFNFSDPEAKRYLFLIKKIKTKRERRVDGKDEDAEAWEGEWVEVELHDAHAAIRDILKVHGKFIERTEHTGNMTMTWKDFIDGSDGTPDAEASND
jgi:hypothetical protein